MKRTLLLGTATAMMFGASVAMAQSSTGTPPAQSGATQQQHQNADKQKQDSAVSPNAVGDKSAMGNTASFDKMVGKDVYGANGEKLGSIDDIILDPQTGKAQVAVIERGGLLGIGSKSIAVDYTLIGMEGDRLVAKQVTEEMAKAMPEFEYGDNMVSYNKDRNKAQSGQSGSQASPHMNQGGAGSGVGGTAPAGAPNSGATTNKQ